MAKIKSRVKVLLFFAAAFIVVHLINVAMGYGLNRYGIHPRDVGSMHHVLFAPFLHLSYSHLLNNLIGFCIFSALALVRRIDYYLYSSLFIIIVGGLLVWQFGRGATHIGASGWVFGLWALNITLALIDRNFTSLLIAIFVIVFYGGMLYGVLPGSAWISWESHLAGAVAGVLWAMISHYVLPKYYYRIARA